MPAVGDSLQVEIDVAGREQACRTAATVSVLMLIQASFV